MSYQRYIFILIIYILDIFMVYIVVYVNFHWLSIFLRLCKGTWHNDESTQVLVLSWKEDRYFW